MKISSDELLTVIQPYGFIECGEIQVFLKNFCKEYPSKVDLLWLLCRVNQCLINNNNGSDYFHSLVGLKSTIEECLYSHR
jgi:hypothetical protein